MIRNSLFKILAIMLIIGLKWIGLSAVVETAAYYNDTETSLENSLSVGTLDFSLTAGDWEPEDISSKMVPGDTVTRDISVINNGSLTFQYFVKSEMIGGDKDFCNTLELEAKLDGKLVYSNGLRGFESEVTIFSNSTDEWNFKVILPENVPEKLEGMTCEFKFVFDGWQENLEKSGFSDNEEVENILKSGSWVSLTSKYSPIADAHINQAVGDRNYGSSPVLKIRSKNLANNRSFVRFDFHFPERTTIISSFLKLFMYHPPSVSRDYEVRRVRDNWKERTLNGITWDNQPSVADTPTASTSSGTKRRWLSWEVTPDVQGFVKGTFANYGWRLSDADENSQKSYLAKFRSRESSFADYRPILEVSFTSPEATTTYPVINEVYYHVGRNKGSDPKNEWVEIYNPTNKPVDISGWQICDRRACDTIPFSKPIPAKGFAVITPRSSTWSYWPDIPDEAIKIVLNSNIGRDGLDNWGDRVILKDNSTPRKIIDAMSYGSDTSQFTLPLSGKGKSLARIVKGYDANSATDWIINATPNPGTNPSEDGVEIVRFTFEGVEVASSEAGLEPLLTEEELVREEAATEDLLEPDTEITTSTEEIATTIEETTTTTEEITTTEESSVNGEVLTDETPRVEQQVGPGGQPVIAPGDNSGEQAPPADNSDGAGDSGTGELIGRDTEAGGETGGVK
ncbi:MAG: hypothetical protein DDT19_02345 [Syntrophomonadaceae bacterium]|nr:hypothetical protein [Bacillota bacterium]